MAIRHPRIASPGQACRQKCEKGVEAAGQTYVAGNLLTESSGSIAIAADGSEATFYGIAETAATGVTGAALSFLVVYPGTEVEFSTYDASDGAELAASSFVKGAGYSVKAVSGVHVIDFDDTDPGNWIFQRVVPTNDDSTSYRGVFTLAAAASSMTTKA